MFGKCVVRVISCVLVFVACAAAARAADTFPGTVITGASGSIVGTTTGASGQTGEPNPPGGGTITSDWFSWTAPASGLFTIGTCNLTGETVTNTDTTLQSFTGAAVNTLTQVASNDDTTGCNSTVNANYGSTNSFNAVSGTTYRFQIDTYQGGTTGTFTLRWGLAGLTVANTDPVATEGGDTATFTVATTSPPAGGTSIVVTVGTSPQCTYAPASLTFTTANYTTPQTVTVTATNDAVAEGTHTCSPATLSATGGTYAGVTATPPVTTINDNDNPAFTINKSASVANIAAPGLITYTITVDNSGSALLTAPTITDALFLGAASRTLASGPTLTGGDTNSNGQMEDTETWIYTATYAVNQADMNVGGTFSNTATFDTAQTAPQTSNAATTIITRTPTLSLLKTWSFAPGGDVNSNGTADVGDIIRYTFAATNSGNIVLSNIQINDVFSGNGTPPVPDNETLSNDIAPAGDSTDVSAADVIWSTLAPGDRVTFTAQYSVNQADVDDQ